MATESDRVILGDLSCRNHISSYSIRFEHIVGQSGRLDFIGSDHMAQHMYLFSLIGNDSCISIGLGCVFQ